MNLIVLIGSGAVGKMTVGQELMKITDYRLFHNHHMIEPVIEIFGKFDGAVVGKLREDIFDAFLKTDYSGLIFTYMWAFDMQSDWDYIKSVTDKFEGTGGNVYYVELVADRAVRIERNKTENRLKNKASKRDIVVSEDFKKYIEKNAKHIISYNLSGYNAIIDPELTERRMQELGAHYKKVKEENPECVIYFESAHYLSQEVKNIVYTEISHYVDIMGMNEEELLAHTRELGIEIDKDDLKDVLQGLEHLIKRYKVQGIIMHTKDYSMYYGSELYGIDLEKALTLGNLLSGTRARVGHYGSLEECRESLKLGLSETGLRFYNELEEMHLDRKVYLVPSRYMEKPVCTIGLGDTFVAGVQFAFAR